MTIEYSYKSMGERVRAARKTLTPYNQDQMASLLKTTRSAYAHYETGRTPIQSRHLNDFCKITGASEKWIFIGEGSMINEDKSEIETLREENKRLKAELSEYQAEAIKLLEAAKQRLMLNTLVTDTFKNEKE